MLALQLGHTNVSNVILPFLQGSSFPYLRVQVTQAARGMSLRKVSYEAFVFPVFSRNQEKTKPLTLLSLAVISEALQLL